MLKKNYSEIKKIIQTYPLEKIKEALEDYHESDIADVLEELETKDRLKVYQALGIERTAEIVPFYDDVPEYIEELDPEYTADILEEMDSDDALDVLNELDEDDKQEIIELMEAEEQKEIVKLDSYDEDSIGSYMTNNYIKLHSKNTVATATSEVIKKAGEYDNIYTIYIVDDNNKYCGAIELRDLIISRKEDDFEKLIIHSYPAFYDDELLSDCINRLKEYAEDSIPVLNRNHEIVGVITSDTVIEATEEELEDDYAKLGGLTEDEDLHESVFLSIKKRLPWLIILLFLGLIVSSVIGAFEAVIATLPVVVFFQSMILDMAGNVGTQSLAVTIRNITDEDFKNNKKLQRKSILKELGVGLLNGLIMGLIAFVFVLIYLFITKKEITPDSGFALMETLKVSGIIGLSMFVSILLSSGIGTAFPLLLSKLKIDPAVASGPFITTMNDIIAVVVYYGLVFLFFSVVI